MPATTALATRSQESISGTGPHRRRARASRSALTSCGTVALFLCRGVGEDHVARLELLGIEDHLLAGAPELLHVSALDRLVLDLEHARPRPLAVLSEPHFA